MNRIISPRQHLILQYARNIHRADGATYTKKSEIFAAVEFLSLPPQKRAEQITQMGDRLPAWLNTDSFRAAKFVGFVQFISIGKQGLCRALVPGEIAWTDPTKEAFVVEITDLGRELLRNNSLL